MDENPIKYTSLKERIEQLIELRKARQLTIEELLDEYYQMREEMMNMEEESDGVGLKEARQLPFYQLLEQYTPEDMEQEGLKDLTELITEIIHEEAVVDWVDKEDIKREIRKKIKRQLRASAVPNKDIEHVTRQIVDLGEIHYR